MNRLQGSPRFAMANPSVNIASRTGSRFTLKKSKFLIRVAREGRMEGSPWRTLANPHGLGEPKPERLAPTPHIAAARAAIRGATSSAEEASA